MPKKKKISATPLLTFPRGMQSREQSHSYGRFVLTIFLCRRSQSTLIIKCKNILKIMQVSKIYLSEKRQTCFA